MLSLGLGLSLSLIIKTFVAYMFNYWKTSTSSSDHWVYSLCTKAYTNAVNTYKYRINDQMSPQAVISMHMAAFQAMGKSIGRVPPSIRLILPSFSSLKPVISGSNHKQSFHLHLLYPRPELITVYPHRPVGDLGYILQSACVWREAPRRTDCVNQVSVTVL